MNKKEKNMMMIGGNLSKGGKGDQVPEEGGFLDLLMNNLGEELDNILKMGNIPMLTKKV